MEAEHAVKARREMVDEYIRGLRNDHNDNHHRYVAGTGRSISVNRNGMGGRDEYVASNSNSNRNDNGSRRSWHWDGREDNLDIPVANFHVTLPQ